MRKVFERRTTAPSSTNKYYIKTTHGGYNQCIQIQDDGSVLPNCTGYARRGEDSWSVKQTFTLATYQEEMLKYGIQILLMDMNEDKLLN